MTGDEGIPGWVQDLMTDEQKFWAQTYPRFSFDERVAHWCGVLFRNMRWQAESGLDPYAIYSPEWYEDVKATEPAFDEIMNDVFSKFWKDVWSRDEYLKRIREGSVT
jgi:hypothetical protein